LIDLAARGESTMGRVPSAAGADARRCDTGDTGDTGISSRSANAADAPAPPEPFGRLGIAGKIKARGGGDAGTSLTTSNAEIARNT